MTSRHPGEDVGVFVSLIELIADRINLPLSVVRATLVTLRFLVSRSTISGMEFPLLLAAVSSIKQAQDMEKLAIHPARAGDAPMSGEGVAWHIPCTRAATPDG
jgi:hypothetical protein